MALDELDDDKTAEAGPKKTDGDDEDSDLLRRLTRWERAARTHRSKWREEARLCYDFVAGHQWTSDDKASLLEQMRQPVTFNRVAPMVDAVTGAEILNRQEVRYSPREVGDVQVNEIITAADEWARQLADTEDEESDSFADCVICGEGWTETLMDYTEDPEGRIIDDRVDPLEMWPDATARKRCYADGRYVIRARWRDKDDLPKKWKAKLPGDSASQQATVDEMQTGWTGPKDDYQREDEPAQKDQPEADKRRVWIRHIQWWDKEPAWRIADPMSGSVRTVEEDELRQIVRMFLSQGMRPPKAVKIEQKKYYEAFLCGNVILETGPIAANAFTLKCITGKRDRNAGTFYGVVRAMIDPQMWGNKFFVQIMHILNTAAKGGLMYEADAFENPRKAIEDWPKPDASIEMTAGSLSGAKPKVQERQPAVFPAGTEKMMEFAISNLPQTSGIPLEMLGLVERDQANVLEQGRKKAGYALLAVFFDSLRRYRKMKGRLRLYFIQNYLSDGRLIRIKGKDSTAQYIPLVRQKDTAVYDVIVDDAPMSPNQKEAVWGMMMAMMPMLTKLQVPPDVWSIMLEYSPLPSSVSSQIREALQKQQAQPPPPDPKLLLAQANMQAANQKAGLEAARDQRKAQQEQQDAMLEQMRDQREAQHEQQSFALDLAGKRVGLQVKHEELQIERVKAAVDLERDRQKAIIDIAAARAAKKTPPKTSVSA